MSAHDRTSPGEPDDPGLAGIGLASFWIARRARRKAAVAGKEIRSGKMLAGQPSGWPCRGRTCFWPGGLGNSSEPDGRRETDT